MNPTIVRCPSWPSTSGARCGPLMAYIDRFNARDFDSVRDMPGRGRSPRPRSTRLRLKGRPATWAILSRLRGGNPTALRSRSWWTVDQAILMFESQRSAGPADITFILLEWTDDRVATIRDFLFARYAVEGVRKSLAQSAAPFSQSEGIVGS